MPRLRFFIPFLLLPIAMSACVQQKPLYTWQKRCDATCAAAIGNVGMAFIETRTCLELRTIEDGSAIEHQRLLAGLDKMDALGCLSIQSGAYHPLYAWQKRCDEACQKTVELEDMRQINGYDCTAIQRELDDAKGVDVWGESKEWDIAWKKAMSDRSDSLHC